MGASMVFKRVAPLGVEVAIGGRRPARGVDAVREQDDAAQIAPVVARAHRRQRLGQIGRLGVGVDVRLERGQRGRLELGAERVGVDAPLIALAAVVRQRSSAGPAALSHAASRSARGGVPGASGSRIDSELSTSSAR